MLMEWSDLESGDKLKFTEEFKFATRNSPWFCQELLKYKTFIIRNVYILSDKIILVLYDSELPHALYKNDIELWITEKGKMWRTDNVDLPIMFDILELH